MEINGNTDTKLINPFHATDLFLYPLKTLENQRFFIFQWVSKKVSGMKWVKLNMYLIARINKPGITTNSKPRKTMLTQQSKTLNGNNHTKGSQR